MTKPTIVFFGSGPVAAQSLKLLKSNVVVEAIITKPITKNEMHAILPDIPVYEASNRLELDGLVSIHHFDSHVGILIDFGIIVSRKVIDAFPLGIINSHFSLLPELRGADPITFAILSGQPRTGVSLMLLSEGMDEGLLLAQAAYDIPHTATTPRMTNDLIELSDATLKAILPKYLDGEIMPTPQETASLATGTVPTYSRKLTKEDGLIDWSKPAATIEREIRAFIQWPKSYTTLAGREVIITRTQISDKQGKAGTVLIDQKRLFVHCGKDALEILQLKPAGKREMDASAFLAGYGQLLK